MLAVQEHNRLPSADQGPALRGITARRGREGFGKENQALNVSYEMDYLYQGDRYSARPMYAGEMVYSPLAGHGNRMRKPSCIK